MKTTSFVKKEEAKRSWVLIDAKGFRVGRLASEIAKLLRGKNRVDFTPHVDHGEFVVVINANQVEFTGKKWAEKKYYRHSRFFGSLKEKTAEQMMSLDPTFILREAVWGMLPKNRLSRNLINKLKILPGPNHSHQAQKPQPINLKN